MSSAPECLWCAGGEQAVTCFNHGRPMLESPFQSICPTTHERTKRQGIRDNPICPWCKGAKVPGAEVICGPCYNKAWINRKSR